MKNFLSLTTLLLILASCNGDITLEKPNPDREGTSASVDVVPPSLVTIGSSIPVAGDVTETNSTITINGFSPDSDVTSLVIKDTDNANAEVCSVAITSSDTSASCTGLSLSDGTKNYEVFFKDASGNESTSGAALSFRIVSPPSVGGDWVLVPGNTTLGTSAFYAMKYEAKAKADTGGAIAPFGCATAANCSGGSLTVTDYSPESTTSGMPWRRISANEASSECTSLGASFDLISNMESMTIARNIENTTSNWFDTTGASGVVGTGWMNRGHTDGSPNEPLSVTSSSAPYDQTGNNSTENTDKDSGAEQKRTHALSNGNEIWDFSGNVWEWNDWDAASAGFDTKSFGGGDTCSDDNYLDGITFPCGNLTALQAQPSNNLFGNNENTGYLYGDYGSGAAALRGGTWYDYGLDAGAFTLLLDFSPTILDTDVGFRCVYRP